MPPTAVEMQGSPRAMASIKARGSPFGARGQNKQVGLIEFRAHRLPRRQMAEELAAAADAEPVGQAFDPRANASVAHQGQVQVDTSRHTLGDGAQQNVVSFIELLQAAHAQQTHGIARGDAARRRESDLAPAKGWNNAW